MILSDNELDQFFNQAREQNPLTSLDETKKAFITATVISAGGVLATKGLLKILTLKKWIIMISAISIITTGAIVVSLNTTTANNIVPEENKSVLTTINNIEKEDNQEETTLNYDYSLKDESEELKDLNREELFELLVTARTIADNKADNQIPDTIEPIIIIEKNGEYIERFDKIARLDRITEEIKPFKHRFIINQNTTTAELEAIKREAKEAGIDFEYKVKYRGDNIRKLNIRMQLDNEEENGNCQTLCTNMSYKGDFSHTIGWSTDENGEVKDLEYDNGNTCDNNEELEETMEEVYDTMEELYAELDTLSEVTWEELEIEWCDLESDLKLYKVELVEVWNELDKEELKMIVKNSQETGKDALLILRKEMIELREELEGMKEEIEIQKEEEEQEVEEEMEKEKIEKEN